MMNIMVLCVGKLKEKYWTDAVCEYAKRLSPYCTLKIDEVKEARLPDNAGPAEEEAVKEAEGREILRRIDRDAYVISLEIKGKELSSEQLAGARAGAWRFGAQQCRVYNRRLARPFACRIGRAPI